jgi:predicted GNAT family acetyltransferase
MTSAQVVAHPDPARFLAAIEPLLVADPVRHSVIGSVATSVVEGRSYDAQNWLSVHDGAGSVVGAAVWTPPYPLVVGPMEPDAARALGDWAALAATPPTRVTGPVEVAPVVARALGGGTTRMRERLLVLGELEPPAPVAGRARPATEDDVDLLVTFLTQFGEDALLPPLPDVRESVLARLPVTRLWEVDGEVVAMAGRAPVVRTGSGAACRIGPVFTRRDRRGRGYASAVTAAVTAEAQAEADVVLLYTDAANPTSNGVYERLGYRAVAEVVELAITPAPSSARE